MGGFMFDHTIQPTTSQQHQSHNQTPSSSAIKAAGVTQQRQMVGIKDRIRKALGKTHQQNDEGDVSIISEREARLIPADIQAFIERYRKSKILLEQMVKQMVAVLDKWSVKPMSTFDQPSPNSNLTVPYHCAEELEPITTQTPQIPGALSEVCMASHATLKDLSVLERRHLIELHQAIVTRVFMQYLVNEVPGVDRIIRQMHESAQRLTQALERCEANPSESNKKVLDEANHDFDIVILEIRTHQSAFPERQRVFADAMKQFAIGIQAHYKHVETSVTSTLTLLENATEGAAKSQSGQEKRN